MFRSSVLTQLAGFRKATVAQVTLFPLHKIRLFVVAPSLVRGQTELSGKPLTARFTAENVRIPVVSDVFQHNVRATEFIVTTDKVTVLFVHLSVVFSGLGERIEGRVAEVAFHSEKFSHLIVHRCVPSHRIALFL